MALIRPCASTVAMAIGAEWNSRAKSELGGAGGFRLARSAAQHQSMGEPAEADPRQTMQDANGKARAIGFD